MNLNINLETGTSLKKFLEDVLKNRFPNDSVKQKVDDSNPNKINLSCPVCGDSEKKKNKKRGNIYLESNTYKCYNDGCMIFMGLDKFIAKYCHAYGLMPPDIFVRNQTQSKVITRKKDSILNFLVNESLKNKLLDLDYFTNRFSLTRIDDFNEKSPTVEYIKGRYLHESFNFSECCYHDSKRQKVFIFNKDDISGKILGLSVRHTDPNYTGPKYKMMNYTEIDREITKLGMSKNELVEVDNLNNIFNILNIDYRADITICEGQFDAMFIRNCIASTGVGKTRDTLDMIRGEGKKRVLLDNDNAGRKESIELLKNGHTVFMWSMLISDLKKKYSNHASSIKSITDINKLYEFMKKINLNYSISDFNLMLDRYFSNSLFDLIYL